MPFSESPARRYRCVYCASENLEAIESAAAPGAIVKGAIQCRNCKRTYDFVWGAPFFGGYEAEDILGLVEIAANAPNYTQSSAHGLDLLESHEQLLERYHRAPDRARFVAAERASSSPHPWLEYLYYRYNEWLEIAALTNDIDLEAKEVLDVGAGTGIDSYRLLRRGARVTAIEFSPVLYRTGVNSLPTVHWVGGFSHLLPFPTASFDHVFCNAALHHMRDPATAVREMLRVLKPGGTLITTSDMFRSSSSTQSKEFEWLNENPSVLQGVNETYHPLNAFLDTFRALEKHLDVRIFTHLVSGEVPAKPGNSVTAHYLREWNKADLLSLRDSSGSLAIRAQVKSAITVSPTTQQAHVLAAADFVDKLHDQSIAMAALSPLIPLEHVNKQFPATTTSKFDLLNGWQRPIAGEGFRRAYKRSRLYLQRRNEQNIFRLSVLAPGHDFGTSVTFDVLINGATACSRNIHRGFWTTFDLDVSAHGSNTTFCVEIRLNTSAIKFDDQVFFVRQAELLGIAHPTMPDQPDPQWGGLPAHVAALYPNQRELSVLASPEQSFSLQALNGLSQFGRRLLVVVPTGQETIYRSLNFDVVGSYPDYTFTSHRTVPIERPVDIILLASTDLVAINRTPCPQSSQSVLCFADGHCELYEPERFNAAIASENQNAATSIDVVGSENPRTSPAPLTRLLNRIRRL